MVALNTAYAAPKNAADPKNRVGNFFYEDHASVGKNRWASRLNAQEKSSYHYETASGRSNWSNRDPIQEQGGLNLYAMVQNNPIDYWDYLGMSNCGDGGVLSGILDIGQAVVGVAGLVPVVGNIADGANALISLARGDVTGALLDGASATPAAGQVTGAGLTGLRASRGVGSVVDGVKSLFKKTPEPTSTATNKTAKEAAKAQFRKEAAGLETKVIRSGRDGTGKIVGVGTGKGGPTYRPKPDGSYSVGKKPDIKHYRPTSDGGHTVNQR